jgi:hypothetical protein
VLRTIVPQVGSVSESISVTAEAARLQTQSAERAESLTALQITETPQKGRIFLNLLTMTTGIINTGAYDGPGDTSGGIGGIQISGSRAGSLSLTNDGIPDLDTGCQCGGPALPNLESIAEVKVMLTNYHAERAQQRWRCGASWPHPGAARSSPARAFGPFRGLPAASLHGAY